MRRDPSLTFEGALQLIGVNEPKMLNRLSKALGGAILVAGTAAGVAALGPLALAPLAMFEPLWGWVDQKNEAIELLKSFRKSFKRQVPGASVRTRRQLVVAAHSTIVIAAYFESL